jgi:hypothetical protein
MQIWWAGLQNASPVALRSPRGVLATPEGCCCMYVLYEKLTVAQQLKEFSKTFVEPTGSFLCSKEPTNGLYPEPMKSLNTNSSIYLR